MLFELRLEDQGNSSSEELRKSWEVCRDKINTRRTMNNVKDVGLHSINKKKQLKGFKKENDNVRFVLQNLILDVLN